MPINEVTSKSKQYSAQHWKDVKKMIDDAIDKTKTFSAKDIWGGDESDQIKDTIFKNILEFDMAVCDISSLNANVMFELGIRLAVRKPVVIICDDQTDIPFDVNDIRIGHRYPVGLNLYKIPEFQKNLARGIISTWNKFKADEPNFTQLKQLDISQKTIIDNIGEEIKLSDAIIHIKKILDDISMCILDEAGTTVSSNGIDIVRFKQDLKDLKSNTDRFIEEIKKKYKIDEKEINPFLDLFDGYFNELDSFAKKL